MRVLTDFQIQPTDDGYILELHRIPSFKNGGSRISKNETHWRRNSGGAQGPGKARPIYLQHGVMSSSVCWLINPSDSSLGNTFFLLQYTDKM